MTPVATPEMTLVWRNVLARVRIRDVHLDEREPGLRHERRGVAQRVAVVREGGRIQDDGLARVDRLVQPADQLGLVVGLPQVDLVVGTRSLGEQHAQCGEVLVAVDVGFPAAESPEVRSIENEHARHEDLARRLARRGSARQERGAFALGGPSRRTGYSATFW